MATKKPLANYGGTVQELSTGDTIPGTSISNVPAGNIVATTVQDAINELDVKKAKLAGDASQTFAVANATLSNQAVNLSQLGSYNQIIPVFATGTLPSTCWGGVVQVKIGATVTLPTANPSAGSKVVLFGNPGGFSVVSNSNQFIYSPPIGLSSGTGPTTVNVPDGGWIELTSRGSSGEYDITGGSLLMFQNTAPAFTNPLVVPNATASNQAVNWAQAGTQVLAPTTSSTITPVAFNTIVITLFSDIGTITVNPGSFLGQRVRVYGCNHQVTTQTNVSSGNPSLVFPDESTSYAWVNNGFRQYIDMVWDNSNWRCTTEGQAIVAAATVNNQAVNLGQLGNASISASFNGLAVTQNVTSLPANYDTNQVKLLQATTPTAGVSYTSSDARILTAGIGPNGPFIRAASNPLDLTNNAGVLVPNAAASNQAINLGQAQSAFAPINGQQWIYVTASRTAVSGNRIAANTTGGAFTITLPASPSAGNYVEFSDGGGAFQTNNLTISRNGGTIMALSEDMTLSTNNISVGLVYNGTTWRIY
jgi:hypothetical protein